MVQNPRVRYIVQNQVQKHVVVTCWESTNGGVRYDQNELDNTFIVIVNMEQHNTYYKTSLNITPYSLPKDNTT